MFICRLGGFSWKYEKCKNSRRKEVEKVISCEACKLVIIGFFMTCHTSFIIKKLFKSRPSSYREYQVEVRLLFNESNQQGLCSM